MSTRDRDRPRDRVRGRRPIHDVTARRARRAPRARRGKPRRVSSLVVDGEHHFRCRQEYGDLGAGLQLELFRRLTGDGRRDRVTPAQRHFDGAHDAAVLDVGDGSGELVAGAELHRVLSKRTRAGADHAGESVMSVALTDAQTVPPSCSSRSWSAAGGISAINGTTPATRTRTRSPRSWMLSTVPGHALRALPVGRSRDSDTE